MLADRMRMISKKVDRYTSSLLHMNGANGSTLFIDETGKTWTTMGGALIVTGRYKFGGASGLFNGSSEYIYTPHSEDFNFGSGDFTIDFWMYPIANRGILKKYHSLSPTEASFQLVIGSGSLLTFYFYSGTTSYSLKCTTALSLSVWHHVAIVRFGNTMYMFIDGVLANSIDVTNITINNSPSVALFVGINNTTLFSGNIDEFRISKGIARWTTNFTPPTAEYSL